MSELSKREKKIARECIDKALQAEFREGLEKVEAIISEWKNGKYADNGEAHRTLHKTIRETDKAIAIRYDRITGSNYLDTVIDVLVSGYIRKEDIEGFNETIKEVINRAFESRKNVRWLGRG